MRFAIGAFLIACVTSANSAAAQCPDGTPPPCGRAASTNASTRRVNPALNPRMWIVVPFGNVTKSADLDWLRDASVNLLSLDLSRWTDIAVVDDKRVGDLVRELPAANAASSLTLSDGLALARRAGAGTLVMGDFYKLGAGARLAANVFDVKSGNRLRSTTQQAPSQDSLLTIFGAMARAVLALPTPAGAKLGATGTTSVDAYQEYLLGTSALNRFELTTAKQHLLRALAIDSTFALAHYKISLAIHWADSVSDVGEAVHANAAARLGRALPPRERALISARVASAGGDFVRACTTLGALVARDSADVEALFGVGECQYHAGFLYPEPIDSIQGRFRGNWNVAIAAFRRVLLLDPSYHPAFQHILDALTTEAVTVCEQPEVIGCSNDPVRAYTAYVVRDADSLLIVPVRGNFSVKDPWRERVNVTRSPLRNFQAARRIAQEWVDAGPSESRAHLSLATIDLRLGQVDAADRELRQIPRTADPFVRLAALQHRVESAILSGRGRDARVILDTLRRETPNGPARDRALGQFFAALGQLKPLRAALERRALDEHWSPEKARYWQDAPRLMLGVTVDSLSRDERGYWETAPDDTVCSAGRPRCRATLFFPSVAYAARVPRTWWPFRGKNVAGFRFFNAFFLSVGDTARLKVFRATFDSIAMAKFAAGGDDQGMAFHSAEAALVLRDSSAALRSTRFFVDSLMPALDRMSTTIDDEWGFLLVPRMMLQRADLAAALGFPDEARTWYARVLDLWAEADAELQPLVARIRAALLKLGPAE